MKTLIVDGIVVSIFIMFITGLVYGQHISTSAKQVIKPAKIYMVDYEGLQNVELTR